LRQGWRTQDPEFTLGTMKGDVALACVIVACLAVALVAVYHVLTAGTLP
jgi:hypothetical protein